MAFLVIGKSAEKIKAKKKTDRRKKNEKQEESQITLIYIFDFKLCFA